MKISIDNGTTSQISNYILDMSGVMTSRLCSSADSNIKPVLYLIFSILSLPWIGDNHS